MHAHKQYCAAGHNLSLAAPLTALHFHSLTFAYLQNNANANRTSATRHLQRDATRRDWTGEAFVFKRVKCALRWCWKCAASEEKMCAITLQYGNAGMFVLLYSSSLSSGPCWSLISKLQVAARATSASAYR